MTEESILLDGKLYSAAEIAAMGIVGLPRSKAAVIARAKAEGWKFAEVKAIGGTRRLYQVPSEYQRTALRSPGLEQQPRTPAPAPVAGTIVAGSSKVDVVKLEIAMRALSEWEAESGRKVSDERRPAVIAVLYEYLQNHEDQGEEAMGVVLRALG